MNSFAAHRQVRLSSPKASAKRPSLKTDQNPATPGSLPLSCGIAVALMHTLKPMPIRQRAGHWHYRVGVRGKEGTGNGLGRPARTRTHSLAVV